MKFGCACILGILEKFRCADRRSRLAKGNFVAIDHAQAQETEVAHGARRRSDVEWIARGYQHNGDAVELPFGQQEGILKQDHAGSATAGTGCPQCEQRLAATGISLRHSGQGRIAGGSATGGLNLASSLPSGSTTKK